MSVAIVLWLGLAATKAEAEPLATEVCAALTAEHTALVAAGLPDTLKKGPEWGKANLAPAKIAEVKRYIDLEEQLLFRCGLAKERGLPVANEPDETDTNADAAPEKPDVPPPLPRRKPARLAKPLAKPAAAAAPAVPAAGRVPPKPKSPPPPKANPNRIGKAKAKAKVDDAYRPPPKAPKANVVPAPLPDNVVPAPAPKQ